VKVELFGDMEGTFDSRKLERAFFNLLLNACEARGDGNGKVAVEVTAQEEEFDIRIKDNGKGIPESIQANVFDPFVSSGKPNGTGLGLAIVNKIVRDHEGSVWVEETSPDGTVIHVMLPRIVPSFEAAGVSRVQSKNS
jgi:signal transduction histidine kinase